MAHPLGLQNADGALRLQGGAEQGCLVASGGLHDHQLRLQRRQRIGQCRVPIDIIDEALGAELRTEYHHIDVLAGHVDAHDHG